MEERTIPEQIVYLFRDSNTEFTRFSSALALLLWSVVLAWPGDTIAGTPALSLLAFWSDGMWSVVLFVVGILISASAIYDWRRAHAAGLLLAMIWWSVLTLAILLTSLIRATPPSPGIATYAAFTVGAVWAFLRYMARHDVFRRRA